MNRPKDCQCKIDLKCLCHYNATSLLYALQLAFVDHNRQNHGTTSNDGERMVEHDHCLLCQKMADALELVEGEYTRTPLDFRDR